jgi:hypothetical protein
MPTFPSLSGPSKNELLLKVAEDGYEDKVRQFLAKAANIEARDEDGWTTLHVLAIGHFIWLAIVGGYRRKYGTSAVN